MNLQRTQIEGYLSLPHPPPKSWRRRRRHDVVIGPLEMQCRTVLGDVVLRITCSPKHREPFSFRKLIRGVVKIRIFTTQDGLSCSLFCWKQSARTSRWGIHIQYWCKNNCWRPQSQQSGTFSEKSVVKVNQKIQCRSFRNRFRNTFKSLFYVQTQPHATRTHSKELMRKKFDAISHIWLGYWQF